jgi:hypothetical protein
VAGEGNSSRPGKRIRVLWAGFGLYFVIMSNGLRYANQIPWQIFVVASIVNMAMVMGFVILLRNEYKKSHDENLR